MISSQPRFHTGHGAGLNKVW